jgi:hypothetical protein
MMELPPLGIPIPLTDSRILSDSDRARLYVRAATDVREDYEKGNEQLSDLTFQGRMWDLPLPGIPLPAGRRILSDSDRARLVVRAKTDALEDLARERRQRRDAQLARAQALKNWEISTTRGSRFRGKSRGF